MKVPLYDIFSGISNRDAVWVECVEGLGQACERMKQLGEEKPGPYFVFSQSAHQILASMDSTPVSMPEKKSDVA